MERAGNFSGTNPFLPHARDDFEAWLRAPMPPVPPDSRVEIRRAQPSEFERIYDLIDDAFGFKRPRALSDWAYRRNPYGVARCWICVERASGKLVGSVTKWPWPLARGMHPLPAGQGGDAAAAPEWHGQGIHEYNGEVRDSDPWIRSVVNYAWPNPRSVRRVRKRVRAPRLIGALPRRALPLRTGAYLAGRGLPGPLASASGRVLDPLFASWSGMRLGRPIAGTVEPVRRFDSAFDDVTRQCMPWEGYWSPHDADFLNWRYLDDPIREHLGFALTVGATVAGYCVIRVHRQKALLMELAAPREQPSAARALLSHAIKAAADAGCSHLEVVAPPAWRHWKLLRSAGFVSLRPKHFMYAYSWRDDTPGVQALESWQFLGGDLDPF